MPVDGRLSLRRPGVGEGFAERETDAEREPAIVRRPMSVPQSDTAEIGAYMGAEPE